jgi:hypothetical protein
LFGEFQKLFGRSFAIGFLLPAITISAITEFISTAFHKPLGLFDAIEKKNAFDAAIIVVFVWLIAVSLLALNGPITRVFVGYGLLNPLRLLRPIALRQYRRLTQRRVALQERIQKSDPVNPRDMEQLGVIRWTLARDFPHEEALIMPTRFGNIVKAAEVYSLVIYGIDSSYGWSRLVAVVPGDYMKFFEDEKAQMDFWINSSLNGMLCAILYAGFALATNQVTDFWLFPAAILASYISNRFATSSARRWGMLFMTAFDLYRSDLSEKLNLTRPETLEQERSMWTTVSQVWIYRSIGSSNRMSSYLKDGRCAKEVNKKAESPDESTEEE